MSKADWFKLALVAGLLYWLASGKGRETIPTWGDSSNTG
jgi:hypothetical protein